MRATGRRWFIRDGEVDLLNEPPTDTVEYAEWTEYTDGDALWYVSDHEDYTLDAEEFGPIP